MEYDGIAEVWVDSLDDWKQVVADTDFVKYIAGNKKILVLTCNRS